MRHPAFSTICSLILLLLSCVLSPQAGAQIKVTVANPNSAAQSTINLDVTVSGSGFKKGAAAQWFVTGTTNPGGVTVNSTAFNSETQLTANITVSSTAIIGNFDIQVTNTDGRSGKGTELFAVNSNGNGNTSCGNYNVTSILNNTDSNNVALQYQSDGLGPYVSTRSGKNVITSIIQTSCSWDLDTTGSTSRGIVVTFAYPDSNGTPPPFIGPQEVRGVFHTQCQDFPANNGRNFGTMTAAGQTLTCPMHLVFAYNGTTYNLGLAPINWPGTSLMQVTCSGASAGQCNSWTVQPDPATSVVNTATNQLSGIAVLFLPSCDGCATGTELGTFLVSFSFAIHK